MRDNVDGNVQLNLWRREVVFLRKLRAGILDGQREAALLDEGGQSSRRRQQHHDDGLREG
jgi:hypothetical protein